MPKNETAESIVREIPPKTRKKYPAEEKIRKVLEGLCGVMEVCNQPMSINTVIDMITNIIKKVHRNLDRPFYDISFKNISTPAAVVEFKKTLTESVAFLIFLGNIRTIRFAGHAANMLPKRPAKDKVIKDRIGSIRKMFT